MESIASMLSFGEAELEAAGIHDARREASSLLEAALERDRTFLIAHPEHLPEKPLRDRYSEFIARRAAREPFHYITGTKEFFGLEFTVTPAVLIPRPETEMLVERSIDLIRDAEEPRFCEVGVGSACISVAILVNVSQASGVGLDISEPALDVAQQNIHRHVDVDRFQLRRSDLLSGLGPAERFTLIVSNPPYIPVADIEGLQAEVRDHEPYLALSGGDDGLDIVRRLVSGSPSYLKRGGTLAFEFGFGQSEAVLAMFSPDIWSSAAVESDLQGIPRIVLARLRG